MSRVKTVYRCSECGAETPKWMGWCTACEASGTLSEEQVRPPARAGVAFASLAPPSVPVPIAEAVGGAVAPVPTGEAELDRVLGGGLVPGSVTVLGGEPGVGKSTLLLQALASIADGRGAGGGGPGRAGRGVVPLRHGRGVGPPGGAAGRAPGRQLAVAVAGGRDVTGARDRPHRRAGARRGGGRLDPDGARSRPAVGARVGRAGPGCAQRLVGEAKARASAWCWWATSPRRAGWPAPGCSSTWSTPCSPSTASGTTPSACCGPPSTGSAAPTSSACSRWARAGWWACPTPAPCSWPTASRACPVRWCPGARRPAPVAGRGAGARGAEQRPSPRRTVQGVDAGRLNQVLAVLERHAELDLSRAEVHVAVAGGVRVPEPGADLAMALAVVSSATERPLPADLVTCGEVGLGGELRQVHRTERRLAEAARLGFRRASCHARADAPGRHVPDSGGLDRRRDPSAGVPPLRRRSHRPAWPARVRRPHHPCAVVTPPVPSSWTRSPQWHQARRCVRASIASCQASKGALIVVGDGPEVLNICSGGFLLDAAFSPQRLSELAKMDGAIILASDASRIARANVHLVPNPNVPTSETGTRHRTAERVPVRSTCRWCRCPRTWPSSPCTWATRSTRSRPSPACWCGPTRRCRRSSATATGSTA